MSLVTEVYAFSQSFPSSEVYGLTSQVRRSAVPIPSNTADGYGRRATNYYKRSLHIGVGSLFELQTQIEIAVNLNYIGQDAFSSFFEMANELDKMLYSLINVLT